MRLLARTAFALSLTLGVGISHAAHALETVPIAVKVELEVNAMVASWSGDQHQAVIGDARGQIAQLLTDSYEHWDFRSDGVERRKSIRLAVVDPDPTDQVIEADLRLEVFTGDRLDGRWSKRWFLPVDIQFRRYPGAATMAASLKQEFAGKFLTDRAVGLEAWLREKVPIARRGEWLDPQDWSNPYRIVISMPRARYQALSISIFEIHGRPAVGLREQLEAEGIDAGAPFPATASPAEFEGLVVQAVKRRVSDSESPLEDDIRQLRLGPIYLKQSIPLSELDFDVFEEDLQ